MENNYYQFRRNDILSLVQGAPLTKVLDVGCASGMFGAALKEMMRCEVWGVEPVVEVAAHARERLDRVICSLYNEEIDLPTDYFDGVFFNDVLEHLADPWHALRCTRNFLKSGGSVYASIPNFLYFNNIYSLLKTSDWRYTAAGTLDRTHLRFFTRSSIIRMFEECGYKVEQIVGINPTDNRKFRLVNTVFPKHTDTYKYTQYFVRAR